VSKRLLRTHLAKLYHKICVQDTCWPDCPPYVCPDTERVVFHKRKPLTPSHTLARVCFGIEKVRIYKERSFTYPHCLCTLQHFMLSRVKPRRSTYLLPLRGGCFANHTNGHSASPSFLCRASKRPNVFRLWCLIILDSDAYHNC